MKQPLGPRIADALVVLAMVGVPLASSSAFVDQYTTVKWYMVHAIAAAWLLVEVWGCRSAGWPGFVRERPLAVAALGLLAAWSVLRGGPARALAPLADRGACIVLACCAWWWFARNRGRSLALTAGLSLSAAATIALGLAQAATLPLPAAIAATEGPAALFGNVNMAAQFVGIAVLLVAATPVEGPPRRRAAWNAWRVSLALPAAVYLYILSTRSVVLALAVSAACLAWGARRRFVPLLAAAAGLSLLALVWRQPWTLDPGATVRKASTIDVRLAVWANTVSMIRDHPLGVGAANFEHAFPPYHARGPLPPWEALVFRGPHNEYLRYLAEDGALFCLGAAVLLALLVVRWRRAAAIPPGLRRVVIGWGVFLAVESLFQFPLSLALGAVAAAFVAGAALAATDTAPPPPARHGVWKAGGTLVALALVAASVRVAWSETLYVRAPDDLASQRRACALDPRNLPACVTAAWLEVSGGDTPAAKTRLAGVLAITPHYPPALRLLGEIAVMEGDHAGACRNLRAYDMLFRGESSVRESAAAACARAGPG